MLLSAFTPTHDPKHLVETYRSLQEQRGVGWEWIICPNGKAVGHIPKNICEDSRVKVVPYRLQKDEKPKIGALKRFACDQASGDAFIELDHDDMLVPNSLEKIAKPLAAGAGFVYSDAAVFVDRDKTVWPIGYGEKYGWETYELRVYGRDLLATRAFDVTPSSLCEVYYAPDHVRVWARDAYFRAGGHDKNLTVGDDHDLICRTYISGARFAHTGGCAYLYRDHPGNTVKSHNVEIQRQQAANRDKYFYPLLDEWTKRHNHKYLDMRKTHPAVKFNNDGTIRIKYRDNSLGSIRCYNFLQYTHTKHYMQFWEEIHRVLIPGGWICVSAPSTVGQGAFMPHHNSTWNERSFNYISDRDFAADMGVEFPKARFQKVRCWSDYPDEKHRQAGVDYVYADLCALKGQRQPGLVRI